MPTPAIGYYGEKFPEVYDQIEVLVSKRLMDVNQLRVSSDTSGPIDSHYLFIKQKLNDYEEGLPVRVPLQHSLIVVMSVISTEN